MKKLYVGNLPYSFSDNDLKDLFAQFGAVESARVVKDNASGRSKGFGFVEMGDAEATEAIDKLNGTQAGDRTIRVDEAQPRTDGGGGPGGRGRGGPGGGGGGRRNFSGGGGQFRGGPRDGGGRDRDRGHGNRGNRG